MLLNTARHTTVTNIQVVGQLAPAGEREQPDWRTTCRFETNQQIFAVTVVSGPLYVHINARNKPGSSTFYKVNVLKITCNSHEFHHTKRKLSYTNYDQFRTMPRVKSLSEIAHTLFSLPTLPSEHHKADLVRRQTGELNGLASNNWLRKHSIATHGDPKATELAYLKRHI